MSEKKRAIIIALILSLIFILSVVWTTHQFLAKQEAASAAIYQNGTLIKIISTDNEETFRIEDGEDWNEITVDKDGIHVSGASCQIRFVCIQCGKEKVLFRLCVCQIIL